MVVWMMNFRNKWLVDLDLVSISILILKAAELNKLFPSTIKAKQEVEEALKAQPTTAKSTQALCSRYWKVDNQTAKTAVYGFWKNCMETLCLKSMSIYVSKEEVESLLSKATQLLDQIQEEGIRQSLAEEVENLKLPQTRLMRTWMK